MSVLPTDADTFGGWLVDLRRQAGISQRQLAVKAGMDIRTLRRWETGDVPQTVLNFLALVGAVDARVVRPDGTTREAAPTEADDVLDQALEEIAAVLERLVTRVSEQERPTASATGQRKRRGAAR